MTTAAPPPHLSWSGWRRGRRGWGNGKDGDESMIDEAKAERRRWQKKRVAVAGKRDLFALRFRVEMRQQAQWYAEARGWQVALTPPQRQKVTR